MTLSRSNQEKPSALHIMAFSPILLSLLAGSIPLLPPIALYCWLKKVRAPAVAQA